jgi:hypothetical protein
MVGFWLRPGNASGANNVVAFTLDLLFLLGDHGGVANEFSGDNRPGCFQSL